MTRPPNWPYRRFDRSPLSVPLDTSVNAPFRGAKVCLTKGGRADRWPQTTAIPTRAILLFLNINNYKDDDIFRIEMCESNLREDAPTPLRAGTRTPGESSPPHLDRGRPKRQGRTDHSLKYTGDARAEDRATRGRDPSADPGAKTGVGGTMPPLGIPGLAGMR